ncbi:MAG: dihydrolipoamide acetyltransferase family protein [Anaerolineales bacterium]
MATQVIMPQLGESVVEGTVTKWLKKPGEAVQEFEPLVEINTDKVDTEIPAPAAGVVLQVLVPEGQTVRAGTLLALLGEEGEAVPPVEGESPGERGKPPAPSPQPPASSSQAAPVAKAGKSADLGFISPVVAKLAAEHQVDLNQVPGTGGGGRITKKDVLVYVETRGAPQGGAGAPGHGETAAPWDEPASGELFRPSEEVFGVKARPEARPAGPAPGTVVPLDAVRKQIAAHMVRSKTVSPHVTTVMEADLSRAVAHRAGNKEIFARDAVNLTFSAYFAAAAVEALKAVSAVNSSWSEQGIVLHKPVHLGIAVSLGDRGLIVPVIRDADRLSLLALARALNDLAERARGRKLKPDEVKGGTFTITNHGTSGSLFATPIINQPQSAILGVGVIQKRVVVVESPSPGGGSADALAIRPMVYLSLTFDHRVLDGAIADDFLGRVVKRLETWS